MPDFRINQSTPTLPVPQAQPNGIDALSGGLQTGVGLGFAAQKMAILKQQQQQQEQEHKLNMLKAYNDQYEKFSDMPSMQKHILKNQILPLTNQLMSEQGAPEINSDEIDFEEDAKPLKELQALNRKLGNKEIDLPTYANTLAILESEHSGNKKFVGLAEKQINDSIRLQQMQNLEDQRGLMHDQKKGLQDQRIDKLVLDYSDKMERNPILKKLKEQQISNDQIPIMINMAKNGNTVDAAALGTKMARTMGEVGVLTESDVTRYITSGKLDRKIGDKLKRMMTGRPTDATLGEIQQIAGVLGDSMKQKLQPIYDTYTNRLSRTLGMSTQDAAFKLDVPYGGSSANLGTGADGNEDLANMSSEDLMKLANGGQ